MKIIKIVFFLPNMYGGVYSYTLNLVEMLLGNGFDCLIVVYGSQDIVKSEKNYVKFLRLCNYETILTSYKKMRAMVDDSCVIISNDVFELDMYSYYRLSNPIFYILHGTGGHYRSIMRRKDFTHVFCDSDSLLNLFDFTGKKPTILYPVVPELPLFNTVKNKKWTIGFVGRLEESKGANLITDLNSILDFHWEFVYPKQGSEIMFIENINDKTCHTDVDSKNVCQILSKCHFLFFPSLAEGFGMVVLEAMRLGVVPIVRDIETGIVPLLTHDSNCIKFTELSNLQNSLEQVISDKNIYEELVENVVEYSRSYFNSQDQCKRFTDTILSAPVVNEKHEKVVIPFLHYIPNSVFKISKLIKYAFS